jgi:hypothetical protein
MKRAAGIAFATRVAIASLALCALGADASALSVYIAPFIVIDATSEELPDSFRPEEHLLEKLNATPLTGSVDFSLTEVGAAAPSSFLEAARLCERDEYPYLIYGFIKKQETAYSSELKLVSREGKHIVATFVATDDTAHYDRLIGDLTKKIADYFLDDLAIVPGFRPNTVAHNVFEIPFSLNYWTPVGDWAEGLMGLGGASLGVRYIPSYPLSAIRSRPMYMGIGLRAEYLVGMNQPGLETAFFHVAKIRLPLEFFLGLGGGNYIGAGLGGLVEFDILAQQRKYNDTLVVTTSTGGASASLMYQYVASSLFSFGLDCSFDAVFYSQPLFEISPRLFVNFSFGKEAKKGAAGVQN